MFKKISYILAFCLAFATQTIAQGAPIHNAGLPINDVIKVESGLISGRAVGENKDVRVYKGIPYAAPPVGDRRWKPPGPVKPWSGVRASTEYGPSCPQPNILERQYGQKLGPLSEDCLYLNVWTPAKKRDDRLPVMVWIHGGAYIAGSGSSQFYQGEAPAREGVIVVTINYRLGVFGFFAHPLLSKESNHNSSGNYGLLDQIAALQWVKRNISAFGGDPARVTVFGESAGAGSICYLMASPLAKGLFHRAIAQSGSAFGQNRHLRETWYGLEPMEKMGERITQALGCDKEKDPLAALRAKSAQEIFLGARPSTNFFFGTDGYRFTPIVDGWVVPDDPGAIFEAGKQHPIPLIVGSNADEGTVFTASLPAIQPQMYREIIRKFYKEYTDQVLALYPASSPSEVRAAINRNVADAAFIANARMFARTQSKVSRAFLYHFTWVRPDARGAALGAFHGSEIPHIFGTLDTATLTPEQKEKLPSKAMMAYWARFAQAGNPNSKGLPGWPAYRAATDQYLELGNEIKVKSQLRKQSSDLFEKVTADWRAERKAADNNERSSPQIK